MGALACPHPNPLPQPPIVFFQTPRAGEGDVETTFCVFPNFRERKNENISAEKNSEGDFNVPPCPAEKNSEGGFNVPPCPAEKNSEGGFNVPPCPAEKNSEGDFNVPPCPTEKNSEGGFNVPLSRPRCLEKNNRWLRERVGVRADGRSVHQTQTPRIHALISLTSSKQTVCCIA